MSAPRAEALARACDPAVLLLDADRTVLLMLVREGREIEPGPERAILRHLAAAGIAPPVPTVVCAWCGARLRDGAEPAADGLCTWDAALERAGLRRRA